MLNAGVSTTVTDAEITIAIWQLETASERLLEFARTDGVDRDAAIRALEARSTLDGHLVAARLLVSSGASQASIATLLRRAAGIVTPLSALLSDDRRH